MNAANQIRLATLLQRIFRQQAADVVTRLRQVDWEEGEVPDLSHWIAATAEAIKPLYLSQWQQGMAITAGRVGGYLSERGPQGAAARAIEEAQDGGRSYWYDPNTDEAERKGVMGYGERKQLWSSGLVPVQQLPPLAFHVRRTAGKSGRSLRFVEKAGRIAADFDLFNPRVVDAVDAAALRFCRETMDTARGDLGAAIRKLRKLLKEGLSRGDALAQLGRDVRRIFADPYRAFRIAATETSRAMHGGQLMAAADSGVVKAMEWLASADACDRCLKLGGKRASLGKPFWVDPKGGPYAVVMTPPLHPHCLLPETPVLAPGTIGAMKSYFRGTCLRIKLAGGYQFSCTPNHMLLSPIGYVRAQHLVDGDDVVCCLLNGGITVGSPHDDQSPPVVSEVFASLRESRGMSAAPVPPSPEYLHGDAAFLDGYIDVVRSDRFLPFERYPDASILGRRFEQAQHLGFLGRNIPGVLLSSSGRIAKLLERLSLSADGAERRLHKFPPFFLAEPVESGRCFSLDAERFFEVSDSDASLPQHAVDDRPADVNGQGNFVGGFSSLVSGDDRSPDFFRDRSGAGKPYCFDFGAERHSELVQAVPHDPRSGILRVGKFLDRFSGEVELRKVVHIERFHYEGPVYDLETAATAYILPGNVVSSNCFCTMTEVL